MRNIKHPLFLLLAFLPLFSLAQIKPGATGTPAAKSFVLTGDITGLSKGAVVKLVNANTSTEVASGEVVEKKTVVKKNGKVTTVTKTIFELKGSIGEPDLYMLSIGELKPYNLSWKINRSRSPVLPMIW